MTEKYLHFIWRNKRLNTFEFTSGINEEIQIIDFGIYNAFNAGPDFKHGAIIIDGVEMHGQIEMHVKSSDWIKHNHHKDAQYNNVILHVVYENDKGIVQNGVKIPTIELKNQIDRVHYSQYLKRQFNRAAFPCEYSLNEMDESHLDSMKTIAFSSKMDQKNELLKELGLRNHSDIFYNLLGLSFSMSVNKNAFIRLMNNVPYSSLKNLTPQNKIHLIMSESGVFQDCTDGFYEFWHHKGVRPSSFPNVRVSQFALLVSHFSFDLSFLNQNEQSIIHAFRSRVDEVDFSSSNGKKKLTKKMIDLLIINTVIPFIWYLGVENKDDSLKSKALNILTLLPVESNSIMNKWKKMDVVLNNAFDSQSLLALYRYFCIKKKCLSCSVGQNVLSLK